MYEKIKRVKAYGIVWNNLKKYIQISEDNPEAQIFIKYIIIPGVNDVIEEVESFIRKCRNINCKHILVDMEFSYIAANQYNKAEGILKETMQYFPN